MVVVDLDWYVLKELLENVNLYGFGLNDEDSITIAYYLDYIQDKSYQNPINLANWLCNDYAYFVFIFDNYKKAEDYLKNEYSDNYDCNDYRIYETANRKVVLEIF